MVDYNGIANSVIRESDIVLLIIDAREVRDSINRMLESRIRDLNKKCIYVVNKVDLLNKAEQEKLPRLPDSIQVSAKEHLGTMRLLRKIMEVGKGKQVTVGVVGYPNVGKSSVINALKGRASASTSPISGHTRGLQKIRISKNIVLIDTPGVFESKTDRGISKIIMGAISAEKLKDPEGTAAELIKALNGKIEEFFGVEKQEDCFETLGEIALKSRMLRKKGLPDTERMSRELIRMWQNGKIKIK